MSIFPFQPEVVTAKAGAHTQRWLFLLGWLCEGANALLVPCMFHRTQWGSDTCLASHRKQELQKGGNLLANPHGRVKMKRAENGTMKEESRINQQI